MVWGPHFPATCSPSHPLPLAAAQANAWTPARVTLCPGQARCPETVRRYPHGPDLTRQLPAWQERARINGASHSEAVCHHASCQPCQRETCLGELTER